MKVVSTNIPNGTRTFPDNIQARQYLRLLADMYGLSCSPDGLSAYNEGKTIKIINQ
jgi:hypothetical protein